MSFSKSSRNISLSGSVLSAECQRADGQSWKKSSIDLDNYLGNIDGQFKPNERDFSKSARDVHLDKPATLEAQLERADGLTQNNASYNLDNIIKNQDGQLMRN